MQLKLSSPKIWFYSQAVDFRKSIDGLVCLVQTELRIKPTDGVFVFYNCSKDKVKLLSWHGNGFVLLYKRLECGKFTIMNGCDNGYISLDEKQLSWLLAGLDWDKMRSWKELTYDNYY